MSEMREPGRPSEALATEVLYGAAAIARFMFGDPKHRRRVYHLINRHALPVFRIGSSLCARCTALSGWISQREARPKS